MQNDLHDREQLMRCFATKVFPCFLFHIMSEWPLSEVLRGSALSMETQKELLINSIAVGEQKIKMK